MSDALPKKSLLDGRNTAPLSDDEIRRVANMSIGLDNQINVRYEARSTTRCATAVNDTDGEYGEIIFSDDIYPGTSMVNPNAALSLKGAITHKLAHYYRWMDKTELPHGHLTHIDEAMTSLEAALRYHSHLAPTDLQGLISDALHRLRLFVAQQESTSSKQTDDGILAA